MQSHSSLRDKEKTVALLGHQPHDAEMHPEPAVDLFEVTHIASTSGFFNLPDVFSPSQIIEGGYAVVEMMPNSFLEGGWCSHAYPTELNIEKLVFAGPSPSGSYFEAIRAFDFGAERPLVREEAQRRLLRAPLLQRITDFQARGFNWDGDKGIAPNKQAVLDARRFLRRLPSACALPDRVYAPGDGEVLFQWQRQDTFAEIGFFGDGIASWCVKPQKGSPSYGDEPITSSVPTGLMTAILAL